MARSTVYWLLEAHSMTSSRLALWWGWWCVGDALAIVTWGVYTLPSTGHCTLKDIERCWSGTIIMEYRWIQYAFNVVNHGKPNECHKPCPILSYIGIIGWVCHIDYMSCGFPWISYAIHVSPSEKRSEAEPKTEATQRQNSSNSTSPPRFLQKHPLPSGHQPKSLQQILISLTIH